MTNSAEREVVFLVAGLSGYTALTAAHGGESAAGIVTRYFQIAQEPVKFKNRPDRVIVFEIVTEHEDKDLNVIDPVCRMQVLISIWHKEERYD